MASRKSTRKKTSVPGISDRGPDTYKIRVCLGRDAHGKQLMNTETFYGKLRDVGARRAQLIIDKRQGDAHERTVQRNSGPVLSTMVAGQTGHW